MKINKKLILISTALLAVAPIAAAPLASNVQTPVMAATKSNATGTLKVTDSYAMLYNRSGIYLDHASVPKKGSTIKYYRTPFFKTFDPGDYSAGELYYPLRKNVYISSDYVEPKSGPAYLTVIFNANIYNKSGKKVGFVKKGSVVKYAGKRKVTSSKAKYYYETSKNEYRLPYTTIKGKDYYYLGSGCYIKVANIGYVDGSRLITHAPITVTVNKNTSTITRYVNSTGLGTDPNNIELKKGQKITVDYAGQFPQQLTDFDHDHYSYYRIKGTNYWVSEGDLNLPQVLENHPDLELADSTKVVLDKKIPLYNINGEKTSQELSKQFYTNTVEETAMYNNHKINEALYLWVPSEKKVELFYHTTGEANTKTNKLDNEGYILASDVKKVEGVKLTPINTASETETQSKTATNKSSLSDAIASAEDVQKTDRYKLADYEKKMQFTTYLQNAKTVAGETNASEIAVSQAENFLTNATKALDGKKLLVGRTDQLTTYEVQKLLNLIYNYYQPQVTGNLDVQLYNSKRNWQYPTTRPAWDVTKKSPFWFGYSTDTIRKRRVDISPLITDGISVGKKKKLQSNAYVYTANGVKTKKLLKKGNSYKIQAITTIKGQKYIKIGADKYVKYGNFEAPKLKVIKRYYTVQNVTPVVNARGKKVGEIKDNSKNKTYVKTYGTKKINGYDYLKIGNNRYTNMLGYEYVLAK